MPRLTMSVEAPPPDPKFVILQAEGGATVQAYLDEQVPLMDDTTYQGFTKLRRPGRTGIPKWDGLDCPSVTFGIMLDGYLAPELEPRPRPSRNPYIVATRGGTGTLLALGQGQSVEPAKRALEVMAGALVRNDPEPPLLKVTAPRVPHDALKARQNRWVIGALRWGGKDAGTITRDSDGATVRQQATLTLLLWGNDDLLERVEPKTAPRYEVEIARTNDSYNSIAARKLGTQQLGRKLAKLNGARDPAKELARGTKVRLPTARVLKLWKRALK